MREECPTCQSELNRLQIWPLFKAEGEELKSGDGREVKSLLSKDLSVAGSQGV